MSRFTLRKAILEEFIEMPPLNLYSLIKTLPSKRKGETLADFYQEVFQKKTIATQQSFEGKNAHDIEIIMMQNLKRIESNKKKR
jgi:alpha-D-ribose 1-methylphosphonate 5-triphosphate diphosphatase PhnM